MTTPSQNTQIVAQGLARLTSAHVTKPNVRAMLSVYLQPFQDLEYATWQVLTTRFLSTAQVYAWPATNSVFDVCGALVGQPRAGLADADYKSLIWLRIAVNRAMGRVTDWSNFAQIILRTGAKGPAYFLDALGQGSFFFAVWTMVLNPHLIATILAGAVPLGVYAVFAYSTWADGNDVEFCDCNNVAITGQGTLGDSVAGLVGGLLVTGEAI